ncbi:LysE family translocator [Pseudonocardia sp. N23]|uniref:LysE family translocator n=1 Tax=Pseudonocardia sp. N23 TaxID=1987376 RepID=UPI000BFB4F05|nr:LysE family transporter [Pseudonocardia sp. N23]GAY07126.1 transporter, LysE family [Pseudonocardia sp. N23]
MAVGTVVAFWAVSLLFVLVPGADWAYVIAAGLRHRSVFPAIGGLLAGHVLATCAVAAGVAALLSRTPAVMAAMTVAGAVYLVWLGAVTLVHSSAAQLATPEGEPVPGSWLRQAGTGLSVSGLNPKVLLLVLALLPQFTDPAGSWPVGAQILFLGVVHVANCALVYTGVGTGARAVLRARPAAARIVTRVSGVVMAGLGVVLVVEQVLQRV